MKSITNTLLLLNLLFERKYASDRPKEFYSENKIDFQNMVIDKCDFGKENSFSLTLKKFLKKHHKNYDAPFLLIILEYFIF